MSFTCPDCGMTSHNPMDEQLGWCGKCKDYTGLKEMDPDELLMIAGFVLAEAKRRLNEHISRGSNGHGTRSDR